MPVKGPWGGGNKTLSALVERLTQMGHLVTCVPRNDIDVVFCVDPRASQDGVTYEDLRRYTRSRGIPLIQRVGDVGTHGKPDLTELVAWTAQLSDRVIFTSEWAREHVKYAGKYSVIPNGAVPDFYATRGRARRQHADIPKIVTHHWSNNPLKGIDTYERLARLIQQGELNFEFTYIGRSSSDLSFCTVSPLAGQDLAEEVSKGDIYLSASLWEAGANHIVEAMACGLPVVYSTQGGSIPEYCGGRGLAFAEFDQMILALQDVASDLNKYRSQSETYVRTIDDVVNDYLEILCEK